jgi:hypothetical protein
MKNVLKTIAVALALFSMVQAIASVTGKGNTETTDGTKKGSANSDGPGI